MAAALAMMATIQGCAVEWTREHRLYCSMDEQLLVRDTLYFGLSIPDGGEVAEADWKRFENDTISHLFPQGFTVLDAHGARRGTSGDAIHEPSRVVIVIHDDDAKSRSAVEEIVRDYRAAFRQEAVLRERAAVCVSR
ncbi:MAG TPA: DUF3574 domain-containing protein [Rhodanobacteraceae bacterium]|nr:DUF3574 domain-containing protein [Rhodanobacteraceae bacterium]